MRNPAMDSAGKEAWIRSALVALALAGCLWSCCAASADARPGLRLSSARCYSAVHRCHAVVPQGALVLAGSGFRQNMLVVFTIQRGGYLINATRAARLVSSQRLRTHVPSDAVSGPIYLLAADGRSNAIQLNVRGTGSCPSTPGRGRCRHALAAGCHLRARASGPAPDRRDGQ